MDQLRLALLDGDNLSVKRSDEFTGDPNDLNHNYIESLTVTSAALMGRSCPAEFKFSPWMNALIGGRGTGKSTAVHFARAALGETQLKELKNIGEGELPLKTFQKFMGNNGRQTGQASGLTDSTRIELVLRHEDRRFKIGWAADGSYDVQQDTGGHWSPNTSQDLDHFGVKIYSQGQLLSMASGNSKPLMDMVDAGAEVQGLKQEIATLSARYRTLRTELRGLAQQLDAREGVKAELDDVIAKLEKLEKSNHAEILKEHQRRKRQLREVETQRSGAAKFVNDIQTVARTLQLADVPDGLFGKDDGEVTAAIKALSVSVDEAAVKLDGAASVLDASVGSFATETIEGQFGETCRIAKQAYDELVEELRAQGVEDPSDYGRLVQERQRLEEALKHYDELTTKMTELEAASTEVFEHLKLARRGLISHRKRFLSRGFTEDPHVKIELEPYGKSGGASSLHDLVELFADWKKGQGFLSELWNDEGEAEGAIADLYCDLCEQNPLDDFEERLERLKKKLIKGPEHGEDDFSGHMRSSLTRQFEQRPALVDELNLWFPDDTLLVQYSQTGGRGDFRDIQSGSPGMKSAALLTFLLKQGSHPIILDQPEDDLDNQLIYDLVVEQLRGTKQNRQFIVVTHNPNIVVNGDAEQVHVMEYANGQCHIRRSGPLQDKDIRDDVCEIMEGGKQAFRDRYKRLG